MRKTSSTGNLFEGKNHKHNKFQNRLSAKNSQILQQHQNDSSLGRSKKLFASKVNHLGDISNIFSNSTLSINNNQNTINTNNQSLISNDVATQKRLYDELMVLKKKVNFLNSQIALEKSSKRKKDVQINTKTRQIISYQSDIKMSKDIAPVNIDKLKNSNIISHLKKEFQTAKITLNAKKNETKNMEAFLKKAKPNIIRQENQIMEQKLKDLLNQYRELLELNSDTSKKLNDMRGLHSIFAKNHEDIEKLRKKKNYLEENIIFLQNNINLMNEANYKNNETLYKQNKNKNNFNKHIEHLMKEKKNKEEIIKMKMTYKQQISKLEEMEKEYKDKFFSNEKKIKELKENIALVERMMKIDPLKMKAFDYSKIKEMERNPSEIINSKILLLQSLINESNNNKKKYEEIINSYIDRFKELGYDYTQLDKEQNNNNNNENVDADANNNNENNKEEEKKEEEKKDNNNNNKINDNKNNEEGVQNNENENVNNNVDKEENEDIVNFDNKNENNNEKQDNNNKDNKDNKTDNKTDNKNDNKNDNNNNDINNNNNNNDKENFVSFERNQNIENNNKKEEDKNIKEAPKNNINNNDNNINNGNNDNNIEEQNTAAQPENKTDLKESIPNNDEKVQKSNQSTENVQMNKPVIHQDDAAKNGNEKDKENNEKKNTENNDNMKVDNMNINNIILDNKNKDTLTNEEFTEFTYILIKNFESKKIGEETARQKIIMIPSSKDPLDNNKFIDQMSFNIMKSVHCDNNDSKEKVKKWLSTLLLLCTNDQKKMTENFLTLFANITLYTQEQEILLSKKVKKCFLEKKDIISKKLEPFKSKYVSFDFLKKLIEEQQIEIKDEYVQYLFYELKKFEDPSASLYDLKVQNLFDIFENNENESKMNTESDIEITNEEYVNIITNFGTQLLNYLNVNNTDLRTVLGDLVQNLSGDDANEKIEVVFIEPFVNRMKEIGIELSDEIKIYCLFSRYKLSDEYEIISVNLLEKELENFKNTKIAYNNEINALNSGMNNDNNINELSPTYKNKVMEKVQEENEENVSV